MLCLECAWKSDRLGCAVLLCLVVCLTLLASFFLPSHLSLKHLHLHTSCMYMYTTCTLLVLCRACWRLCWTRLLLSSARSRRDVSVSLHTLTTAYIHTAARHVQCAECDVLYCLTCSACCRLICRIAEVVAVYQISPSETRKLLLRMQARPVHLVSYSPFCC